MADRVEKTNSPHLYVKLAETSEELERVFRLRYQVFVEESGNGRLANKERVEQDRFDLYCDHLIVKDWDTARRLGPNSIGWLRLPVVWNQWFNGTAAAVFLVTVELTH